MKKRNVTYACGHRSTVQSTGTKEEHDMKVSRLDEYILCPNCELMAHKTGKSMIEITAALGCRKVGCAELTGSEKQILWAETIRFAHLMALDEFLCDAESALTDGDRLDKTTRAFFMDTEDWLKNITESKWWIDDHAESCRNAMRQSGRSWRSFRKSVEIFGLAIRIICLSPHMTSSLAVALEVEGFWKDEMKKSAKAAALSERIKADKDSERDLVARALALHWRGVVKPWGRNGSNGATYCLYLNDMKDASISWVENRFEKTVRFTNLDDTPESRRLAVDVWRWCISKPNSNSLRSLHVR